MALLRRFNRIMNISIDGPDSGLVGRRTDTPNIGKGHDDTVGAPVRKRWNKQPAFEDLVWTDPQNEGLRQQDAGEHQPRPRSIER